MDYKKVVVNNKLLKWWLGLRFLILPILVLAPFLLVTYTSASCMRIGHTTVGAHLQGGPIWYSFTLWTVVIIFIVVSFLQTGSRKVRIRHRVARHQVVVAFTSVLITAPVYFLMRQHSQALHPPTWSCDSQGRLYGHIPSSAHFGIGLAPVVVIITTSVYLFVPLFTYLVTRSTRSRVGGHTKHELFQ